MESIIIISLLIALELILSLTRLDDVFDVAKFLFVHPTIIQTL